MLVKRAQIKQLLTPQFGQGQQSPDRLLHHLVFLLPVLAACLFFSDPLPAQEDEAVPAQADVVVTDQGDESAIDSVDKATLADQPATQDSLQVDEQALTEEISSNDEPVVDEPVVVEELTSTNETPELDEEPDLSVYESPSDPVTTYLNAIDNAEVINGAYSLDLADLYLGLGNSLLESNEIDSAKEAFQQGMQVVRVNFGLDSPEQTDYLFEIANIENYQGNIRVANKVLSDVYMINSRNFGQKAPEMLPVLNQLLDWYGVNRPPASPINRYEDLERTGRLTHEMAEIIELEKGLGHPDTTDVYRRQGQIHWRTAKYVLGRGISVEPGVIMATGKPSYSVNVQEVSIKAHYRDGRDAFAKVAESVGLDENSTAMEHAESIAQLGDWNLAFGKKQAATLEYQRSYSLLAERLRSESVADVYFKDPVPIRFMNDDLQIIANDDASEASIILRVSMTITEGGRALNIKILDPPESFPPTRLRVISREINGMHFRPRLTEGTPVKSKDFIFSFPINSSIKET
ncbi:MAG: tetratricopeptide (TPR) repeat protein [Lysobacterales bacterium]|jgi:tetratricopeptide (TPR) repeat protein